MSNLDDMQNEESMEDPTKHHAPVPDEPAEAPTVSNLDAVPDNSLPIEMDAHPPKPPSPRILLIGGCGTLAVLGVIGVIALIVSLVRGIGWTTLNTNSPSTTHPDGMSIALAGEGDLRVKMNTVPRETFLNGEAGSQYQEALTSIPSYLQMKSPLYITEVDGDGGSLTEIAIPNDSEPYETLSLYQWDDARKQWVFVPNHIDEAAQVIRTDERPGKLAVFQIGAVTPLISTTLEDGHLFTPESASTLNMVFPTGLTVRAQDNTLDGALIGGWELGKGYAVIPVIRVDGSAVSTIFTNPSARSLHINDIRSFVVGDGYNGIAIDYRNIKVEDRAAFATFIQELGTELDGQGRLLVVYLPAPQGTPDAYDTGGYDWRAIGAASDAVMINTGLDPLMFVESGQASQLTEWAVGEVDRLKLHLVFSSLSLTASAGEFTKITYDAALEPLGGIGVLTIAPDGTQYPTGTPITFDLNGGAINFQLDPATGIYNYYVPSGDQVQIVTAEAVRRRLDLFSKYHIGGMMVADMLDAGNDANLLTAVNQFKANTASSVPNHLVMKWTINGASGAVLSESTGIGTPLVWQAAQDGEYIVQGNIVGGRVSDRGAVNVRVGAQATDVPPTPTATTAAAQPTLNPNATAGPTRTPAPTRQATNTPPPSVGGGGGAGGALELGGQVPGSMGVAPYLTAAGMTWAKFQAKWPYVDPGTACSYVSAGRAAGFKVLLSIPGPLYPTSIDFASYVEHLRAVAAGCQPDAMEIWNEMNIINEWPKGQIDPASYVNNMLAPGFNAIKQASPNTMVIIGALAPTGFDNTTDAWSDQRYLQGLAAAGAANYANCVGAHHNSGTTSPSVRSGRSEGNHYSWYFLPTIEVTYNAMGGKLPVCITEFGYVSPEGYGPLPANFSWGADNTVAEQAAWLKEGADLARGLGWVRLLVVWNVGFSEYASDPQAGYSIIRPDGSCPACDALP